MITPFDNDTGVSDTIVFRLDNNYPPVVKIDSVFGVKRVTGAYRDSLRFYFSVTDVEGDTVFVSFYYRSADTLGSEWRQVVTFSGDSVRINYVLRDDEGDTLRIRQEYSEDGEVWKVCSVFGDTVIGSSRYSGSIP